MASAGPGVIAGVFTMTSAGGPLAPPTSVLIKSAAEGEAYSISRTASVAEAAIAAAARP